MSHRSTSQSPTEGALREQLAAYFLSVPPPAEQTEPQRREYYQKLEELGALERRELLQNAGVARPPVWGNPAPLLQALLCAAQRLAASLGRPLMLFPAKGTVLGCDTLFHPRVLSVTLMALLRRASWAAEGQPVWVRLQEQQHGLAVSVTGPGLEPDPETLALIKECTRLHSGSLVHCANTVVFTCGQAEYPPTGVHLFTCPTEQELLQDSLSPVWSGFYAGLYASGCSSDTSSGVEVTKPAESTIPGTGSSGSTALS